MSEAVVSTQRKDRISGIILALLMLAAFALVIGRVIAIASGPLPPAPGAAAPAFSTAGLEGSPISLADHRDKVLLVDFWATWCPPCVASMPSLERLHQKYGARGFVVLGVNQEAGEEPLVREFVAKRKLTFPIAMDGGTIAHAWGVYSFPTSFLIGRDGLVREMYRGPASESRLASDIEAALAGAPR